MSVNEDIAPLTSASQLGATLRERRLSLGLSQDAVCRSAGVARSWLARVESGDHGGAEVQKVLDLAGVLGLVVSLTEQDDTARPAPVRAAPDPPPDATHPPSTPARSRPAPGRVAEDPFEHLLG